MQHKSNDCHTGTLKGGWRGEREEKVEGGGTGAGGWPISQSAGSYITTTRTRRSRHRCVLGVRASRPIKMANDAHEDTHHHRNRHHHRHHRLL